MSVGGDNFVSKYYSPVALLPIELLQVFEFLCFIPYGTRCVSLVLNAHAEDFVMEPGKRDTGKDDAPELDIQRWLETGQFESVEDLEIEEIVVGEPEPAPARKMDFGDAETSLVDNLSIGTWLEFHPDRSAPLRARLAAIDAKTSVYVFTDRNGYIVAKCSRNGLIADFRRQSVGICRNTTRAGRVVANAFFELKRICTLGTVVDAGAR